MSIYSKFSWIASQYLNFNDFFNLCFISAQFDFIQLGIIIVFFYVFAQNSITTRLFYTFVLNGAWLLYTISWFFLYLVQTVFGYKYLSIFYAN